MANQSTVAPQQLDRFVKAMEAWLRLAAWVNKHGYGYAGFAISCSACAQGGKYDESGYSPVVHAEECPVADAEDALETLRKMATGVEEGTGMTANEDWGNVSKTGLLDDTGQVRAFSKKERAELLEWAAKQRTDWLNVSHEAHSHARTIWHYEANIRELEERSAGARNMAKPAITKG